MIKLILIMIGLSFADDSASIPGQPPMAPNLCNVQVMYDQFGRQLAYVGFCNMSGYKCIVPIGQNGANGVWCDRGPLNN